MKIADIIVNNRTRKDLGDIQSLADSIREVGLLNPITICYDARMRPVLIAGSRRLKAFELLNREEIPARAIEITMKENSRD